MVSESDSFSSETSAKLIPSSGEKGLYHWQRSIILFESTPPSVILSCKSASAPKTVLPSFDSSSAHSPNCFLLMGEMEGRRPHYIMTPKHIFASEESVLYGYMIAGGFSAFYPGETFSASFLCPIQQTMLAHELVVESARQLHFDNLSYEFEARLGEPFDEFTLLNSALTASPLACKQWSSIVFLPLGAPFSAAFLILSVERGMACFLRGVMCADTSQFEDEIHMRKFYVHQDFPNIVKTLLGMNYLGKNFYRVGLALPLPLCPCSANDTRHYRSWNIKSAQILKSSREENLSETLIVLSNSSEGQDAHCSGNVEVASHRSPESDPSKAPRGVAPDPITCKEIVTEHMSPIRGVADVGSIGSIGEIVGVVEAVDTTTVIVGEPIAIAIAVQSQGSLNFGNPPIPLLSDLLSNGVSDLNVDNVDQPFELPGVVARGFIVSLHSPLLAASSSCICPCLVVLPSIIVIVVTIALALQLLIHRLPLNLSSIAVDLLSLPSFYLCFCVCRPSPLPSLICLLSLIFPSFSLSPFRFSFSTSPSLFSFPIFLLSLNLSLSLLVCRPSPSIAVADLPSQPFPPLPLPFPLSNLLLGLSLSLSLFDIPS
ncbi:hypothetical protein ACLOJK_037684 [Asimina triloba]